MRLLVLILLPALAMAHGQAHPHLHPHAQEILLALIVLAVPIVAWRLLKRRKSD